MKIVWFGHATFILELDSKIRVIFDPYDAEAYGSSFRYRRDFPKLDIALISHGHRDHNFRDFKKKLGFEPVIIDSEGEREIMGVKISGRRFFHDDSGGSERGEITAFSVGTEKGLIVHFGDLGHIPQDGELAAYGSALAVMVPVGGTYTLDGEQAAKLVESLSPRNVFPMHYKTDRIDFPIEGPGRFADALKGYSLKRCFEFDFEDGDDRNLVMLDPYEGTY